MATRRQEVSSRASAAGLTGLKRPASSLSRPASRQQAIAVNRQPLSQTSSNTTIPSSVSHVTKKTSLSGHASLKSSTHSRPPSSYGGRAAAGLTLAATRSASASGESGNEASTVSGGGNSDGSQGNIKVVVRCRGANARELAESQGLCVSTNPTRGQDVQIQSSALLSPTQPGHPDSLAALATKAGTQSSLLPADDEQGTGGKLYNFDHVFGEQADQSMLYNDVVAPVLNEVLQGYNCTIFAYGQTGTGKTYTMEGDLTPSALGTFSSEAGIIPRTLHRLFHLLEGHDFTVRVSFMELYNEELRDLNGMEWSDDNGGNNCGVLKIFDDSSKKGGVVVQGLEETHITSAAQGIKVLTKGSKKRQIASTNFNDKSSRSHSIFTITIHLKEVNSKGEDIVKIGKMNLVDLAGSENIGRSGAMNGKAREAGMINQSLLTLGRVINALVDKSPHIPYRESKLTRLLQDSLGGRTKTCIIATVSPAKINLEETMSTLDYAMRAKSIRNRPEQNQKTTKTALLNLYSAEIERLKADLFFTREKNGIYFSQESFDLLTSEHDARKGELKELKRQLDLGNSNYVNIKEQFDQALRVLSSKDTDLRSLNEQLEAERANIRRLEGDVAQLKDNLNDEITLRSAHDGDRRKWKGLANTAVRNVEALHGKLDRKDALEDSNSRIVAQTHDYVQQTSRQLQETISTFHARHQEFINSTTNAIQTLSKEHTEALTSDHAFIDEQMQNLAEQSKLARSRAETQDLQLEAFLQLVESMSQDLAKECSKKQDELQKAGEQVLELVARGCQNVLLEAGTAFQSIIQTTNGLHAAASAQLSRQADFIQRRAAADSKALQSENEQLRAQNDALGRALLQQKQAAQKWQTELLTTIATNVSAFNVSQDELLQKNLLTVQASLDAAHAERKTQAHLQQEELDVLGKDVKDTSKTLAEQAASIDQAISKHTTSIENAAESLQTDLSIQRDAMALSAVTGKTLLQQGVELLQGNCERFEQARTTQTQSFYTDFDALVSDVRDTYKDLQEDLEGLQTEFKEDVEQLAALTTRYSAGAEAYIDQSGATVSTLQEHVASQLGSRIVRDVPTGATPMKRRWPEMQDAEEDIMEADRALILEHLRTTSTQAELEDANTSDIANDALAPSRSGQRLSSTLAARKAARRSSVLAPSMGVAVNRQ